MTDHTIQMTSRADASAKPGTAAARRRPMVAAAVVAVLAVLGAVVSFALAGGSGDAEPVGTDTPVTEAVTGDGGDQGPGAATTDGREDRDDRDDTASDAGETGSTSDDDGAGIDDPGSDGAGSGVAGDDADSAGPQGGSSGASGPGAAPTPAPGSEPTPDPEAPAPTPAQLVVVQDLYLNHPWQGSFEITNAGQEDLDFSFGGVEPEVEITGDSASPLPGGATRTFDIAVDLSAHPAGVWSFTFDVFSNGGDATVDVTGDKVPVPAGPVIDGPDGVLFGSGTEMTIEVGNIGGSDLHIPLLLPAPFGSVSVAGTPATIPPGGTHALTITVDTTTFDFGDWTKYLTIPSDGGSLELGLFGTKEFVIIQVDLEVEPAPFVQVPVESGVAMIPIGNAIGGPVEVDIVHGPGTWGDTSYVVPAGGGAVAVHFPPVDLPPGVIQMRTVTVDWPGGSQFVTITTIGT